MIANMPTLLKDLMKLKSSVMKEEDGNKKIYKDLFREHSLR